MQSTGAERRGLIVLLSIIAILIVTALLTGFFRSRGSDSDMPSETSVKVIPANPDETRRRTANATDSTKRPRAAAKPARPRNQRQYRQRDFYEETLDR